MWAEQVPALLAAGFRVLRIDMRGHGGSDPVAGDYTMDQLAADVAAIIEALGIGQMHLIGLSIGGMIGQAFAINYGTKLKSLMLCDTSPGSPPDAKDTWAPRIAAVAKAGSLVPWPIVRWNVGSPTRSSRAILAAGGRFGTPFSVPPRAAFLVAGRRFRTSISCRACRH
jgi:pimeloyl-ACP methyl ester carboxylesterase